MNRSLSAVIAAILLLLAGTIGASLDARGQVQRNVVLEFCTGTWCQWCPCGDQAAEALLGTYPDLIVLAYHGASTDPWQNFYGNAVRSLLGFSAYPTAIIDRRNHPGNGSTFPYVVYTQWNGLVTQRYTNSPTTNVDIAVVTQSYNSTSRQLDLTVSATALQTLTGQYKMSLILTEDSLIYQQTGNATCGYPPSNYVHKWTVRSMVNGPSGENLNSGTWNQNESLTKTFTTTLDAGWTAEHCMYTVMVHKDSTSALYYGEIYQAIQQNVTGLTGVSPQTNIPAEYSLTQNYPNPFNPTTSIRYQLPTKSHITLKVFDLLSREVATLVDGIEESGDKSVQWNASGVTSGVYFYRLKAGEFTATKKLMVLK
jgi:hypothetical protein